jgi:hypothetical protein
MGLVLVCGMMLAGSGCKKPDSANLIGVFVTVTSVNDGRSVQSDVVRNGYTSDDEIPVTLKSESRTSSFENLPTEFDNTSSLDTVIFSRYHVSYSRTDGGPNPADFSAGFTFSLPPEDEITVNVVIVRAFDKNLPPLKELWDRGQIFTTATITFFGEDGHNNDFVVSGSIPVSFANFAD